VEYFESPVRKDQRARAIAARDGITGGPRVCLRHNRALSQLPPRLRPRVPDDPAGVADVSVPILLLARYRRLDNAFLWLEDPGRVQRPGEEDVRVPRLCHPTVVVPIG
jgi:hypothetical protein